MSLFIEDASLKVEEYVEEDILEFIVVVESPESLDSYPSSYFERLPLYLFPGKFFFLLFEYFSSFVDKRAGNSFDCKIVDIIAFGPSGISSGQIFSFSLII